jgi:large subunit ribosomal protein L10
MTQAHVAPHKKEIVKHLKTLFKEYPIIGCVNMQSLPSPQLQQMRAQLRSKVVIYMAKRNLIKLAIEDLKKDIPTITKLEPYLEGMPAFIFTRDNPFALFQTLKKNKSSAPAKAGQISPKDINVSAGPTPFAPGPIISELAGCGIKAGIDKGKVVIKEDKIIVRKGEVIQDKIASMLARLKIEPMEIGLDLVAVYENGEILSKDVLAIEPQEYIDTVSRYANEAMAVAMSIGYACKDTIMQLLSKAHREARAIAIEREYPTKETVALLLVKAEAQAAAVKSLNTQ